MSVPIIDRFPDSCIDPLINFCTEVQLQIVRFSDTNEVSLDEQLELLRVSSCLQKLCNYRMSNIFKQLENGKH